MEKQEKFDVTPIDFENFKTKYSIEVTKKERLLKLLEKDIESISKFSIAPHFWFVSSRDIEVLDHSDNIDQLTPLSNAEWKKLYPSFLQHIMPEEDFNYFMGASAFMLELMEKAEQNDRKNLKFSIYCRMQDKNKNLRWVVFQFPKILYDKYGKMLCGLVCISDLGIFNMVSEPKMTIMDISNKKNPYYVAILDQKKIENLDIPNISKREREVLACIIKGMKTPEIAEKLCISYHTVENHKRNLREKTNTKTSGELVNFVLKNQLM